MTEMGWHIEDIIAGNRAESEKEKQFLKILYKIWNNFKLKKDKKSEEELDKVIILYSKLYDNINSECLNISMKYEKVYIKNNIDIYPKILL